MAAAQDMVATLMEDCSVGGGRWAAEFKHGRDSLEDDPNPGWLVINDMIFTDQQITK